MSSLHLDDPLSIQVAPTPTTPTIPTPMAPTPTPTIPVKTVSIRMKELPGSVSIEIPPLMASLRDLVTRFHELTFAKTYAAFATRSSVLAMRVNPRSGAAQEMVLTQIHEIRDGEVLVYKPCDELRALVEQGCITPVVTQRLPQASSSSAPPPSLFPTSSPSMKRKGRCASVANTSERVQRYAPMLDKTDLSPRERNSINDHLISGDEQVVDAMEQFSMSLNPETLRRALRGPSASVASPAAKQKMTTPVTVDHLLDNFSTMEMQSPANLHFYDSSASMGHANPFLLAASASSSGSFPTAPSVQQQQPPPFMMMMMDHHEPPAAPAPAPAAQHNPFLASTTRPPLLQSRPSLLFDDSALTEGAPSVFLHSIQEKRTPPPSSSSRMSLSLDDLDDGANSGSPSYYGSGGDLYQPPQLICVASLLENVPVDRNFHEKYTIGRILGSGKYSVVKEATCLQNGTKFAVKIIDKRQMMEMRFLKRELEIMHGLKHDGVVQLMELFETNEELFLVMELCSQELFEYIDKNGPLDELCAQKLISKLVQTVAYLHANCIVHRDIKPENILIRSSDVNFVWDIKLTDFGIARKLDEGANCTLTPHESLSEVANLHDAVSTVASSMALGRGRVQNRMARAHTKCGTRDYVAPEVMSGKGYGNEADLWSVGVVTYVLLSGCAPVFLPTQDGTKKVFFTEDCWHDMSLEVKSFIEALLVRNPEERSTAVEALDHPWLQGVHV